jgi:predicted XRE-type DNA-binding protein
MVLNRRQPRNVPPALPTIVRNEIGRPLNELRRRRCASSRRTETHWGNRTMHRADTPAQAANLRARAELMQQIVAIVKKNRWAQTRAAQRCGITQPRRNDLLRGRVSRFSLDALVNIATAIGRRVHVELEPA